MAESGHYPITTFCREVSHGQRPRPATRGPLIPTGIGDYASQATDAIRWVDSFTTAGPRRRQRQQTVFRSPISEGISNGANFIDERSFGLSTARAVSVGGPLSRPSEAETLHLSRLEDSP